MQDLGTSNYLEALGFNLPICVGRGDVYGFKSNRNNEDASLNQLLKYPDLW